MTALVVKMMDIDVESRDVGMAQLIKYQPNKRIQSVQKSSPPATTKTLFFFIFYMEVHHYLTVFNHQDGCTCACAPTRK